ncbi:hypothetical protein [Clostridium magnum]|uniref:Uncharacterized protein n=1 Tax=Clostridium magnum DSM 2767 TaxID=1121326 RepID=A0A161WPM3_9CLOT|nr:hypothetical protein [Clostridium magnum]KZL88508.1 hypothetical protein CLMAG_61630 [Clostridium magnum DSM 2767]SHJ12281.1 hypothetical protein SAMN02745944_05383 [Clostridium magnum DSM 2767]
MIYWYQKDERFEPGTVADQGDIRLKLSQPERYVQGEGRKVVCNTWKLYLSIRTYKENGVREDLKRAVVVAVFKECNSLEEAQNRAEKWLKAFIKSMR